MIDYFNMLFYDICIMENLLEMCKILFCFCFVKEIGFYEDGFLVCSMYLGVLDEFFKEVLLDFYIGLNDVFWINMFFKLFEV